MALIDPANAAPVSGGLGFAQDGFWRWRAAAAKMF
jgi:hypothetical protein